MLRLLRYAPTPSKVDEGKLACGAHTDYGLFTLLATDSVPGLQVFDSETNEWIPVRPPREDMFVLNVGDLMQFWSDGAFKSTKHRVVMDGDRERYSMAFFEGRITRESRPTRRRVDDFRRAARGKVSRDVRVERRTRRSEEREERVK